MDESRGKQGVGRAWVVLGVIFVVFVFALSKFGKDKASVYNQQINSGTGVSSEQVLSELKSEQDSEMWGRYMDKIFEARDKEVEVDTQDLSAEYQKELEDKVLLPEEVLVIQGSIVSNGFNERAKYLNEFEGLYINATKKGVFTEAKLFAAQAASEGQVLKLSDYDKETVLRLATEYELWAREILKLDTPAQYEKRSLRTVQDILQVSYILRKAVVEEDNQVYVMWIGKYTQKVFDILAVRYVK